MTYLTRTLALSLKKALHRGKSVLLLGPRQVGKTTLIKHEADADLSFSFADPETKLRYEKDPPQLGKEIRKYAESFKNMPLIVIDEVQKIPIIMDLAQQLIDDKIARFLLTGSSARKLRRSGEVNLLPGRVVSLQMSPLTIDELPDDQISLTDLLLYGALPEITLEQDLDNKETDLRSYVTTYLEEEVRAEALVRKLGSFIRFLEVACSESGNILNASKLSQEIGVTSATISDYYQILDDCLIAHRIDPISNGNTRRRLIKSPKYLIFDLGVRRIAANEGRRLPKNQLGHLFEQFIGLELIRLSHLSEGIKIRYWRDSSGPEVDFVIEESKQYIPVEVKWSDKPNKHDAKHLELFMNEYPQARQGYIICQTPMPYDISERVTAISWRDIQKIIQHSQ